MSRHRFFLAALLTALLGLVAPLPLGAEASSAQAKRLPAEAPRPTHARDRLLVRFSEGVPADSTARAHGFRAGKAVGRTGFTVVETGAVAAEAARDRLRGKPGIEAVELDLARHATAAPNDPGYAQGLQYPLQRVGFPAAWDVAKASSAQKIAVIDSGVNLDHPDLTGKLLPGYDFVDDDALPQDGNGHGTTVAGVAAAETDNEIGIAGASWGASIMPLRALDNEGDGFDSDIAAAMGWAVQNGATVINLSLGGPGFTSALQAAVDDAAANNVVVVAATGNDGHSEPSYPAAFPSVLAVGATDDNGDLVYFSQHGPWVDIAAPGIDVLGPKHNSSTTYAYGVGTSFASPIVAGAAALVRTWAPTLTAAQVVDRLQATAQDNGPVGKDSSYGWGVLDVAAAVGAPAAGDIAPRPGDAHEPNASSAAATLVTTSATATISPETDVDWYAVDVPAPGTVTVVVTPVADQTSWQAMDPTIHLYGPSGALVGSRDADVEDKPETLTVVVASTGRYAIKVANAGGSRSPSTYALAVTVPAATTTTTSPTTTTSTTTTSTTVPPTTTTTVPPTTTTTAPPPPPPPARSGYWMADATGHVYAFGDSRHHGALDGARGNVVDIEPTASGNGYRLLTSTGEIFTYGDAAHLGQPSGLAAGEVVTSMSSSPVGPGYWVFTSKGRAFAFGVPHLGDMAGKPLNGPVLDSVATPTGRGYYMVASDGGIFAFGDAGFRGSMGGLPLNAPVQSLVPDGDNDGYWLVASDGGVFAFNAGFRGSMGGKPLNRPMTGMVRFGNGYVMVAEDGGAFVYSDKPFFGSLGGNPPASPVVAVAALEK